MIGKEWTREYFDDYVTWVEHTLLKLLKECCNKETQNNKSTEDVMEIKKEPDNSGEMNEGAKCNKEEFMTSIKNKLSLLGVPEEEFVEYFLQSNNGERYPEMAFLLDVNYIDNYDMNQFYFSLLKDNGRIVIEQNDKIKGLKLLLSEFLYLCGYDEALEIQKKLLSQNVDVNRKKSSQIIGEKKIFEDVKIKYKNGTDEAVTIFYGKIRGYTTWYIKTQRKIYRKIIKNNKGEYICGDGKTRAVISDNEIIEYISKDYN